MTRAVRVLRRSAGRLRHRRPPADPGLLRVDEELWTRMTGELERRGAQRRESGAFLLAARPNQPGSGAEDRADPAPAPAGGPRVTRVEYYDDLDAECLTGGITMSGRAYDRLWSICRDQRLRVVGDVHTHPGAWVDQSVVDRGSPMMAHAGHVALIVPRYATAPVLAEAVGVHRYLGSGRWERAALGLTITPGARATGPHGVGSPLRWLLDRARTALSRQGAP